MAYRLVLDPMTAKTTRAAQAGIVQRVSDGAFIPDDPTNADNIAYRAWLKAGNSPDPVPAED